MRAAASSLAGPLPWVIAWRFLRGRNSRLLNGTARAALLSTGLGVTAMIIAMALMTGYSQDLQGKLVSGNGAVIAYPGSAEAGLLTPARRAKLAAIPGVRRIDLVAYGQGSLGSARVPQGLEVVLRGIDAGGGQLTATAAQLRPTAEGIPSGVLGKDLADRLGARPGDLLRLVALGFEEGRPHFHYQSLRVSGTFSTGFAEFDRSWVLMDRILVERLMGGKTAIDLVEFKVADPDEAPRVAAAATRILRPDYAVTDWRQMNRELFTALRFQKLVLFFVLLLIVAVSTFNIASTLVVLVRERMRDVGLLGALGLRPALLRSVFLVYGGFLGAFGTLLGVLVGSGLCWVLTTFRLIRFDPEVAAVYFIDSVPFRVVPWDLFFVVGAALVVTIVACFIPAWLAARVDPSSALRYE